MHATVVPLLAGLLLLAGCATEPQELTYEEYLRSSPTGEVLVFDFPDRDGALLAPHVVRVPRGGSADGRQLQRQQVAWAVRATTMTDLPVRVVDERANELVPPTRAQPRSLDRASLGHFEELLDLMPQSEASSSPTKTPAA